MRSVVEAQSTTTPERKEAAERWPEDMESPAAWSGGERSLHCTHGCCTSCTSTTPRTARNLRAIIKNCFSHINTKRKRVDVTWGHVTSLLTSGKGVL